MLVFYVLKSGKNVLLISIEHEDHDIRSDPHRKNKTKLIRTTQNNVEEISLMRC